MPNSWPLLGGEAVTSAAPSTSRSTAQRSFQTSAGFATYMPWRCACSSYICQARRGRGVWLLGAQEAQHAHHVLRLPAGAPLDGDGRVAGGARRGPVLGAVDDVASAHLRGGELAELPAAHLRALPAGRRCRCDEALHKPHVVLQQSMTLYSSRQPLCSSRLLWSAPCSSAVLHAGIH